MTVPSERRIFVITLDGSLHSVHLDCEEANEYLSDLRQRHPTEEWTLDDLPAGRLPGHDKLVWGGIGVWDWETRKITNFGQAWVWLSEATWTPPKRRTSARHLTIVMGIAASEKFSSVVEKSLKGVA